MSIQIITSKSFIMIELTFLKELMLVQQANQKSVIFATIGIFQIKALSFNQMSANRYRDSLTMSINLSNIAILNIKGSGYHCIINGISKNEVMNLLQNADLTNKVEYYRT